MATGCPCHGAHTQQLLQVLTLASTLDPWESASWERKNHMMAQHWKNFVRTRMSYSSYLIFSGLIYMVGKKQNVGPMCRRTSRSRDGPYRAILGQPLLSSMAWYRVHGRWSHRGGQPHLRRVCMGLVVTTKPSTPSSSIKPAHRVLQSPRACCIAVTAGEGEFSSGFQLDLRYLWTCIMEHCGRRLKRKLG